MIKKQDLISKNNLIVSRDKKRGIDVANDSLFIWNSESIFVHRRENSAFCYCILPNQILKGELFVGFQQSCFLEFAKTLDLRNTNRHIVLVNFSDSTFHKQLHFCYAYRKQKGLSVHENDVAGSFNNQDLKSFLEHLIIEYFSKPDATIQEDPDLCETNPIFQYNSFLCTQYHPSFTFNKRRIAIVPFISEKCIPFFQG